MIFVRSQQRERRCRLKAPESAFLVHPSLPAGRSGLLSLAPGGLSSPLSLSHIRQVLIQVRSGIILLSFQGLSAGGNR